MSNPNESPSTEEKINTANDRTYDYKLSGGKYYYSLKGQNNWVEANGKKMAPPQVSAEVLMKMKKKLQMLYMY